MDPRVTTTAAGLQQQFDLSKKLYDAINRSASGARALLGLYSTLQETDAAPSAVVVAAVQARLDALKK
jgi:hypothetical protein